MKRWAYILVPILIVLLALLSFGLTNDPRYIPSPLIGKSFPVIEGIDLNGNKVTLGKINDKPLVVNVWASWCVACRAEHKTMLRGSRKYADQIELIGIDYKDEMANGKRWLATLGNPYEWSFFDQKGRAGLELGVYGVPETFFVSTDGIIIHKHTGPLTDESFAEGIAKFQQATK
jgi:cytochrome c biogenesis protein CcmG/thiol:disulfide interchange protein DsbE